MAPAEAESARRQAKSNIHTELSSHPAVQQGADDHMGSNTGAFIKRIEVPLGSM